MTCGGAEEADSAAIADVAGDEIATDAETGEADETGDTSETCNLAQAGETVVLGHFPEYIEQAEEIGGQAFSIPTDVWEGMTSEEQWTANQSFLEDAVARGSEIQLATPAEAAREGSFYERELQYLQSKGYTLAPGGTTMVPPGG